METGVLVRAQDNRVSSLIHGVIVEEGVFNRRGAEVQRSTLPRTTRRAQMFQELCFPDAVNRNPGLLPAQITIICSSRS